MPQSLAQILVHLIFSTKNREPILSDDIRPECMDSPSILINSVADRAHVLFHLSKNQPLCNVIEVVKKDSSKWIKTKGKAYRNFHWQNGYGAFSVSQSNVDEVIKYIEDQKEHHCKRTFQEEFRAFLKKYQMPYDERYVWD
ncbi:MAG: transposase [Acidobacteria bacterium]|nr:MAG: transposase [Acidobacteriota bacterium]